VLPPIVHQYWRHQATGRLWAVELVDGTLRGVCGPLDPREAVPGLLPVLPFDFRDLRWVRDHADEFVLEAWDA
jgi:hypothetical protein